MANQTIAGKTNYNTDPNHIYYNLQAYNNDTVGSSQAIPVRFTETRTSTILANPSEYFLSIIRFHLDTPNLPLFLPCPETSATYNPTQNVNQLVYQIAIYKGGSTVPVDIIPIIFNPQLNTSNFNPAPAKLDLNALSNPYYFVFQFQDFIDMINQSIQKYYNSTSDIATRMGAATNIPYFGMDAGNRFTLYFPSFVDTNTLSTSNVPTKGTGSSIWNSTSNASTTWMMAFNAPLHTLFSSFRYQYIDSLKNLPNITPATQAFITSEKQLHGWYLISNRPSMNSVAAFTPASIPQQPATLEQTNQMGLNQLEILPISAVPFAGNIYSTSVRSFEVLHSPYSSAPLWNPCKQLIFTTSLMPVNNELVGLPVVQNSDPRLNSDVQNNNFSPIITDLEVPLISGDETKCNVSYSPSGEYRLIDLQSNQPINSIEISVYWKDQYGTLHPFTLESGCFSSLKLLFRKKVFNLIYLPEYTKPVN